LGISIFAGAIFLVNQAILRHFGCSNYCFSIAQAIALYLQPEFYLNCHIFSSGGLSLAARQTKFKPKDSKC
jgi:hypothetical protein